MKKLLASLILLSAIFFVGNHTFAKDCLDLSFSDGDICISMDKDDDEYTLDYELEDTNGAVSLKCDILLPDNTLKNLGACNGDFTYSKEKTEKVKLYVRLNNEYKTKEAYYDFDDGERGNSIGGSSSNGDLDEFDFYYIEDSSPDKDERITVRIKALDDDNDVISDYDEQVTLHFQRDGDDADDYDLKIQSDDFNEDEDDLDSNGEIDVDFDNGYLEFEVWFEYEDEYTITVEDGSVDADQDFDVGDNGSSSNGDVDNFYVTTNDSSPETDERVDLTIKARDDGNDLVDDYDGTVVFEVYYRTSSSSSRYKTTSSTYFEIDDDYEDGYEFDSDDDGLVTLDNFIEFKKDYDFKVLVEDEDDDDIYGERIFYVDDNGSSSNGDLDEFDFYYVEDSSPDKDERITVRIKALDDDNDVISDYDEQVTLHFQRDGDDADDYDLKIQSDDFNEDEDDLDSNGEIDVDFDNGYLEFEVWFEYEDEYTITVEDGSVDADQDFDVGDNGSSSNGFSSSDIDKVEGVYNARPALIDDLEDDYPALKTNNTRQNMSDDFYDEMENIINGDDSIYDNYDEFYDGFLDRYSYTIQVRD
ncbi:hypothetical protein K9M48_05175 [Candidatus Gracilibacteria bacterium]|nr:hypothetical protein [Candidatus Gracilibacteria bacterium]